MRIVQEIRDDDEPVNRIATADLCDLWGIQPGQLTALVRRGTAIRIGHGAYDLVASTQNYIGHLREVAAGRGGEEHQLKLTQERARLASEQADAQALKNAELRGEVVRADETERAWTDVLRRVRGEIMAVPARLRPDMTPAAADALDRELRAALASLGGENGAA